mmetsp:Transcript_4021/g.5459  ORF Transcript_4021/g.5459 Transcript_4021/m.5459 type:complete len:197 (-) Transcript_4021:755-1345(-)|eukprot:CAMPEP_0116075286 /NCGR_PEP_ID=MMETSP0322-20121206/16530_1 /TAXON_ID=163516 /ORGANISM="Leptocylindrus danicus var. apora, Strain B651" /LENGTH=196 /DNA_ID=CAMNT_0003565287 /DNA_START=14 /DNA_END=604 /DNA_ORIENTATION=-
MKQFITFLASMVFLTSCMMITPAHSLNVGKRRILCSKPLGGKETDALMNSKPTLPAILGYVGVQALLPTLAKCPNSEMWQRSGYLGSSGASFCPPEYWDLGLSLPGIIIILAAVALNVYANINRLVVTDKALGVVTTDADVSSAELIDFNKIEKWSMTPVGLLVQEASSGRSKLFPAFWDNKSVQVLLEDRMGTRE